MSADKTNPPIPLAYTPRKRKHLFNILLVVVDDLRADHLRAGGGKRLLTSTGG